MRRLKNVCLLSLLILAGCTNTANLSRGNTNSSEAQKSVSVKTNKLVSYESATKKFTLIKPQNLELPNFKSDKAFVYFGRKTCPYCREFVPKLSSAAMKENVRVNYLDTEHTQTDQEIQQIRKKYKVETVPTLVHLNRDGSYTTYDDEAPVSLNVWIEQMKNS